MTKKYSRTILAIRGDTQGGHAGGLLNPETEIPVLGVDEHGETVVEDTFTPELRPFQRKLWQWHEVDRKAIGKLAGKDPIIFLEMGDLTQGNIFKDDLASTSLTQQMTISAYSMFPWLDMPQVRASYIVRGTGVHVWGEGSTETMLTQYLKTRYPKKKINITDHYLLDVGGLLVDIAHHGPGAGMRPWTRGNAFELYVKGILIDDIMAGRRPPDLVLRAHHHEFTPAHALSIVGDKFWQLPGYITPPMCFIGSHAQKVMMSPSRMSVGLLAFEIVNGKILQTLPMLHTIDLRTQEVA